MRQSGIRFIDTYIFQRQWHRICFYTSRNEVGHSIYHVFDILYRLAKHFFRFFLVPLQLTEHEQVELLETPWFSLRPGFQSYEEFHFRADEIIDEANSRHDLCCFTRHFFTYTVRPQGGTLIVNMDEGLPHVDLPDWDDTPLGGWVM